LKFVVSGLKIKPYKAHLNLKPKLAAKVRVEEEKAKTKL
jgi:hypothetical protein